MTICAEVRLRNIFASNISYDDQNIPSHLHIMQSHEEHTNLYKWVIIPAQTKMIMSDKNEVCFNSIENMFACKKSQSRSKAGFDVAPKFVRMKRFAKRNSSVKIQINNTSKNEIRNDSEMPKKSLQQATKGIKNMADEKLGSHRRLKRRNRKYESFPKKQMLDLSKIHGFTTEANANVLWTLDGERCIVCYHNTIILLRMQQITSSKTLEQNVDTQFIFGHSGSICAMAVTEIFQDLQDFRSLTDVSNNGMQEPALFIPDLSITLLATAESNPCVVYLWNLHLRELASQIDLEGTIQDPNGNNESNLVSKVISLCFSPSSCGCEENNAIGNQRMLCVLLQDSFGCFQFVVYTVTIRHSSPLSRLVASVSLYKKQSSKYPISYMAFSAYNPNSLVSCGLENIRLWCIDRDLKEKSTKKTLTCRSLAMLQESEFQCTVFTYLDFGRSSTSSSGHKFRPLYVSTNRGSIYTMDYDTKEIMNCFQAHNDSVAQFRVLEAYCITLSVSGSLKVWGQLKEEIRQISDIASVHVSTDESQIACLSQGGKELLLLKPNEQSSNPVMQAHAGPIHLLKQLDFAVVTVSNDQSIRFWDNTFGRQIISTHAIEPDTVNAIAAQQFSKTRRNDDEMRSCDDSIITVIGFNSGVIKIVSLSVDENVILLNEQPLLNQLQPQLCQICDVVIDCDSDLTYYRLYASGKSRQLISFDGLRDYETVAKESCDFDENDGTICLSPCRMWIMMTNQKRDGIIICDSDQLTHKSAIDMDADILIKQILFCRYVRENSSHLLTLLSNDVVHIYKISNIREDCGQTSDPSDSRHSHSNNLIVHKQYAIDLASTGASLTRIALSPCHDYLVSGNSKRTIRIWQWHKCKSLTQNFQHEKPFRPRSQAYVCKASIGKMIKYCCFSSSGRNVFTSFDSDKLCLFGDSKRHAL